MRTEYDFSKLKRRKIKVTINLDPAVVRFFKEKAREEGTGYQTLINEALKRVVEEERLAQLLKARLLSDENFIATLAQKIEEARH